MRKAFGPFRNQSIFIKMFAMIFASLSLILSIIAGVVYAYSAYTWRQNIQQVHLQAAQKGRDVGDSVFGGMVRLATQLSLEKEVQQYVLFKQDLAQSTNLEEFLMQSFRTNSVVYEYVDSIYLVSLTRQRIITNRTIATLENFDDISWQKGMEQPTAVTEGGILLLSRAGKTNGSDYPYFISLIKPIVVDGENALGYVIVNLDVTKLNTVLNNTTWGGDTSVWIVDDKNTIYLQKQMRKPPVFLYPEVAWAEAFDRETREQTVQWQDPAKSGNKPQIISCVASRNMPFWYITSTPLGSYLSARNLAASFSLWIYVASMAVSVLITWWLTKRMYAPLKKIVALVSAQEDPKSNAKRNEMEYIMRSIQKFRDSNTNMQEMMAENLLRLEQAQTVALQAQINPHFLHNTLETIRFKTIEIAGIQNPAAQMLADLSTMFKISMETDEYLTSVRQEVEYCKSYLKIMEQRYDDMFSVRWEIEPQAEECRIIKLSLQPILENAIYHGIKPKRKQGNITVTASVHNDILIVCVADDGVGMSEEKRSELNCLLHDESKIYGRHIGLRNVATRIRLIFGKAYGLVVTGDDGGTAVEMWMPVIRNLSAQNEQQKDWENT